MTNSIILNNGLPELYPGMRISTRPANIEHVSNHFNHSKWARVLNTLKIIDTTKCVEVDVTGHSKMQLQTIRQGIRNAAKNHGFLPVIHFGHINDVLYIWTNK